MWGEKYGVTGKNQGDFVLFLEVFRDLWGVGGAAMIIRMCSSISIDPFSTLKVITYIAPCLEYVV
jgi:hypothetical protein